MNFSIFQVECLKQKEISAQKKKKRKRRIVAREKMYLVVLQSYVQKRDEERFDNRHIS